MRYVRTTYIPATNLHGAKIKVEDLSTGKSKTFPVNYAANNKHQDAAEVFTGRVVRFTRETRTGRGNVYRVLN